MNAKALVDTNILVYAFDESEGEERDRARAVLAKVWNGEVSYAISLQSLQEFYAVVTRKMKPPMPASEARGRVESFLDFPGWVILLPDGQTLARAMELSQEHSISFWDAHIVSVALRNDIQTIITGDRKGFQVPGIIIVDPFAHQAAARHALARSR